MVIIVVVVAIAILGDTGCTQRNLSLRLAPVADTLQLGIVFIVLVITLLGDVHDRTTCVPAAARHIVVLKLGCDGHVAGEDQATESEELLSAHVDGSSREVFKIVFW